MDFTQLATSEAVAKTIAALKANGIEAIAVKDREEAKNKLFELLPKGASVMNMSSTTLDQIGASQEIVESGQYDSVKKKFSSMDSKTQGAEMRMMGAAPEWTVGSVHAVTQDGKVMIASNTGSQLPAYAYGAGKVIWVVGGQKIVDTMETGFKRIYEHSLVLESERAKKAYGVPGSSVNKILIVNKEWQSGRITIIFVNEVLGF